MIEEYDTIDTVVNNVVQKLDRGNQIQMSPEDAKHEGWLAALEVLAKGKEHENLEAYLYLRVRGHILNTDKAEWKTGMTGISAKRVTQEQQEDYEGFEQEDLDVMDEDYLDLFGVEEKTPLDFAEEAQLMRIVSWLLTEQEKDVLKLLYYKDLSYREAGNILGVSYQTVLRIHDEVLDKLRTIYAL